ncbi:MAG: tRNA (uridine(54)-C5)-methyltransferase TrmA, partial [bacterium]
MNPINPAQYDAQLEEKLAALKNLYADFPLPEIDVFSSSPSHYRMRAEFRIWHEGGQVHYAMNPPGEKRPQILASFPVAAVLINQLMELLLPALNQSEILRKRLFAAEFMCTLSGESIITLIYHR